jgi:hypothetical protein
MIYNSPWNYNTEDQTLYLHWNTGVQESVSKLDYMKEKEAHKYTGKLLYISVTLWILLCVCEWNVSSIIVLVT